MMKFGVFLIWILIKEKKELSAFDNAINKAIVNNINVAYSNDSFELWYCLHFEFIDQQHRRDTYYTTLSKN